MESLDFLGGKMCFYTNNQETIKSKFGGLVSSVCVIVLGLLVAGFGQDFFKRTNPQIVQSTISSKEYQEFIINNKNFSVAFRLEDDNGLTIDRPDLFYVEFRYYINQKNEDGSWEELENTNLYSPICNTDMIYDNSTFLDENDQVFCPQLNNLTVGGYWDYNFVKAFEIHIFQCLEGNFTPDNKPCSTQKEKEEVLSQKLYFSLFYQVIIVNPHDYNKGLQRFMKNDYFILDPILEKNPDYYFEENIMKTDYGWLMKDVTVENLLGFKYNRMDIISRDLLNNGSFENSLARITLYFQKDLKEFRREYSKAQTLAAQVGGVLKFFLSIGGIIVSKYNLYMMKLSLGNLILDDTQNQKEDINSNRKISNEYETSKNNISRFSLKNNTPFDIKCTSTVLGLNNNFDNTKKKIVLNH